MNKISVTIRSNDYEFIRSASEELDGDKFEVEELLLKSGEMKIVVIAICTQATVEAVKILSAWIHKKIIGEPDKKTVINTTQVSSVNITVGQINQIICHVDGDDDESNRDD